ncbi:hypothetical protein R1flu_012934 [Riccia fluitans]|uniref:Uncharacterized protein n=1 Tax=Riccia fluitans TaxID=41844 RepID=A0ABD1ZG45_9MARC
MRNRRNSILQETVDILRQGIDKLKLAEAILLLCWCILLYLQRILTLLTPSTTESSDDDLSSIEDDNSSSSSGASPPTDESTPSESLLHEVELSSRSIVVQTLETAVRNAPSRQLPGTLLPQVPDDIFAMHIWRRL